MNVSKSCYGVKAVKVVIILNLIILMSWIAKADEPTAITIDDVVGIAPFDQSAAGPLSYQTIQLSDMTIPNLTPLNGGAAPSPADYRDGVLFVQDIIASAQDNDGEAIYRVVLHVKKESTLISGLIVNQKLGYFAMTQTQIQDLMKRKAAHTAATTLSAIERDKVLSEFDCNPLGSFEDEGSYREAAAGVANAPINPPLPPERYERGTRSPTDPSPTYDNYSPGHFATGETTAVGDGTGIINTRENDPNASNQTPGCEVLSATEEQRQNNPNLEMNEANLTRCIEAIQDYILQGVPQPPSAQHRSLVFRRLFDLPNQEQEFAAAIFTVDGEAGHHARENPMEGIMVLKTLSNRRDNANGVEDELQRCREQYSDRADRSACFGQANANATFNLLDVALDRVQYSMYNSGSGGNWTSKFGHKRSGQFTDSINSFIAYGGVENFTIQGGNGNADINKIYHYHTPDVRPDWRRDNLMLRISGTHETLGNLEPTNAHVFYFNHDMYGATEGDGWRRNVRHEFRNFP